MPKLVRFYIRHTLAGFAAAGVFVGLLLWFNVANLWHLISTSDVGLLAAVLLVVFHGIVFSGVQFGIAIMRLGDEDGHGPGGKAAPVARTVPVPLPVRGDRR